MSCAYYYPLPDPENTIKPENFIEIFTFSSTLSSDTSAAVKEINDV